MAEAFYTEHQGKPFFAGLVEVMTSGPLVALVLAKHDAVQAWRELAGPTDVFVARMSAPRWCVCRRGGGAGRQRCGVAEGPERASREGKESVVHMCFHRTAPARTHARTHAGLLEA